MDLFYSQMPAKQDMRPHHIPNGHLREIGVIRLAFARIPVYRVDFPRRGAWLDRLPDVHTQWPGAPITGSQDIGAHDKMVMGIDWPLFPDDTRPPMGCIRIGRQGMTYPYHIAALRIEPAISVI